MCRCSVKVTTMSNIPSNNQAVVAESHRFPSEQFVVPAISYDENTQDVFSGLGKLGYRKRIHNLITQGNKKSYNRLVSDLSLPELPVKLDEDGKRLGLNGKRLHLPDEHYLQTSVNYFQSYKGNPKIRQLAKRTFIQTFLKGVEEGQSEPSNEEQASLARFGVVQRAAAQMRGFIGRVKVLPKERNMQEISKRQFSVPMPNVSPRVAEKSLAAFRLEFLANEAYHAGHQIGERLAF